MSVEIERKYRLSETPEWLGDCRSEEIEQGYLAIAEDGTEVRLRHLGEETLLTVKRGAGERRLEEEIDLDPAQFDALWPLTKSKRVSKTRHFVPHGDLTIEVDVFKGALGGMVVGEVEFESEDASAAFDPPEWLGKEVTGDQRYANESLAVHGAPRTER
jgi:adenylate cyclase